jgi:predicted transcriptional regulator of viral defense system
MMPVNRLTERFFQSTSAVFTQPEVAVALDGTAFSRHGLVKRALAGGEILNIRRGLYCLAPRYQKKPVNVYALAQRVYGPSYVSLETALRYHGWIPEAVYACTCASYGNAKEFNTPLGIFSYVRVPQQVFYAGVERCVDSNGNAFLMASPAKALADYVYVHRLNWTSIDQVSVSMRIEPEDWASAAPELLELLVGNYSNRRVKRFLAAWKEALAP